MVFAFTYPFMKRITYWPQLFLGVTFNWGLIMAWTAMTNNVNLEIIVFYILAIFWTLGYDTIYGAQDMSDDEIIGLKSTSIKFKDSLVLFVSFCYLISIIFFIFLFNNFFGNNMFTFFLFTFVLSLCYQLIKLKDYKPGNYLTLFRFNNFSGLLLFIGICTINL